MALGDYILCCKCEVKLIYDGDRGNREWWKERFGSEPEIMCPDCEKEKTFVGLTDKEIRYLQDVYDVADTDYARAIEAKLREKNS